MSTDATTSNPVRILVAEDEALIRMDLVEMLEEAGYLVVAQATNGEEAIALAAEHQPDLAILDVKMPVLDGISAAEKIISIAPVLMLTAFSQREVIEQARDAGALAYLVKPFQKTDLVPAIELAIGRFREMMTLSGERDALGEQLELRKLLDRAKGLLIDKFSMTEQSAFEFIQKNAMSTRAKMVDVANQILSGHITP